MNNLVNHWDLGQEKLKEKILGMVDEHVTYTGVRPVLNYFARTSRVNRFKMLIYILSKFIK
jgi:hypothetical protein